MLADERTIARVLAAVSGGVRRPVSADADGILRRDAASSDAIAATVPRAHPVRPCHANPGSDATPHAASNPASNPASDAATHAFPDAAPDPDAFGRKPAPHPRIADEPPGRSDVRYGWAGWRCARDRRLARRS